MSKRLIGPYWVADRRQFRDDQDRVYLIKTNRTWLHITNPTDREGIVDLVFFEQRGDGDFIRAEYVGGSWSAPPMWQRSVGPDPSRIYGTNFTSAGWFEVWTNVDALVIDAEVDTSFIQLTDAGRVESRASRTLILQPKAQTAMDRMRDMMNDMMDGILDLKRSRLFAPGEPPAEAPVQEISFDWSDEASSSDLSD